MARNITLESIGIETELIINGDVERGENNAYSQFGSIMVCNDDEYYQDQIEYKMFPVSFDADTASKVDEFCDYIMHKKNVLVNGKNWVGTHVHMFLNRNGKGLSNMFECKLPIVDYLLSEVSDFFVELIKEGNVETGVLKLELERITHSHNIWRYFDYHRTGDSLRRNLATFGSDYTQFSQGTTRAKYAPVIWSLENQETGKPLTLELRIFPNSFLLIGGGDELCRVVSNCFEIAKNNNPIDESEVLDSIRKKHLKLVSAYFHVSSGRMREAIDALKLEI